VTVPQQEPLEHPGLTGLLWSPSAHKSPRLSDHSLVDASMAGSLERAVAFGAAAARVKKTRCLFPCQFQLLVSSCCVSHAAGYISQSQ
jgi:hypothetical protein